MTRFSSVELTKYIPHEYPFRLVDSIQLVSESEILGWKYIGWNEPFFQGHFPGNPIMPGVLQVEMIAQVAAAGLAAKNNCSDYKVLLASIDKARFYKPVFPGCLLEGKITVARVINGIYVISGILTIDSELVSEVEIKARLSEPNRTLSIIKPDAVSHAQNIIEILKLNALNIEQVKNGEFTHYLKKQVRIDRAVAEEFYKEHADKPFFTELCDYMTTGDSILMVLKGEDAVTRYRNLMGATDPKKAAPGTLRSLFGTGIDANAVHGSDSVSSAAREIAIMFPEFVSK